MRRILKALLLVAAAVAVVALAGSGLWPWVPKDETEGSALSLGEVRVTVDVRNAGGVAGMARVATDHLRSAGLDVVGLGNAATFGQDSTVVVDRVGDLAKAAAVARVMGVRHVVSEPDSNLFVDVTVRLGSDWERPAAGAGGDGDGGRLVEWLRGLAGRR